MTNLKKPKIKFAIYKNGKRISKTHTDAWTAIIIAIDMGCIKIVRGATWGLEERIFKFDNASFPELEYSIEKAPDLYEIRKITEEVWT